MSLDDLIYMHEDVFVEPGHIAPYVDNLGSHWPWSEANRWHLIGVFGHLRIAGRWPRAVILWETTRRKQCGQFDEQFGGPDVRFPGGEVWWLDSTHQRWGGFDRFMTPGPGSPTLRGVQQGPRLPCVVQQITQLRPGATEEYLAWVQEQVAPATEQAGWRTLMWFRTLHGSAAHVYFAAPTWDAVDALATSLPPPRPAWEADVETALLDAWAGSGYLRRDVATDDVVDTHRRGSGETVVPPPAT